jgi:hypothetical protein
MIILHYHIVNEKIKIILYGRKKALKNQIKLNLINKCKWNYIFIDQFLKISNDFEKYQRKYNDI